MSDPSSSRPRPSLLGRMSAMLNRSPEDRAQLQQLQQLLSQSQERDLLDADAVSMIEGVLQVAELTAGEIMVPRAQMDVIDIALPLSQLVPYVIRTAHTRFPVIEGGRDDVIGILNAKELLRLVADPSGTVRSLLRPATFIPESKRLNVLLRDFRLSRNHIAVVVDEYGGVAGLITIEDVLEQIVGDIEDEFDLDDASDNIVEVGAGAHGPRMRVLAATSIAQFNERLGAGLDDSDVDTVGGLVTARFGRVPRRGDAIELDGLRFEVLRAAPRSVRLLMVEPVPAPSGLSAAGAAPDRSDGSAASAAA
jgi:magnesium and cobalt transporter